MTNATSYYLNDGRIIFAYNTQMRRYPPWVIGVRSARGKQCGIARYTSKEFGRYKTEAEARSALRRYAEANGLKPAY